MFYRCPCCAHLTLAEQPPGTYQICEVCHWEDDPVQFEDREYAGGANAVTLNQARRNFAEFGASARHLLDLVRQPRPEEIPPVD